MARVLEVSEEKDIKRKVKTLPPQKEEKISWLNTLIKKFIAWIR